MASNIKKPSRRRSIWHKAGGRCAHCGRVPCGRSQTIDHFIPRSRGGSFDRRNLMPLCRECNESRKSQLVNPAIFYVFATEDAIKGCISYEREFMSEHKNAAGEVLF